MSPTNRISTPLLLKSLQQHLGVLPDSVKLVWRQDNYLYKVRVQGTTLALKMRPDGRVEKSHISMQVRILRRLGDVLPSAQPWNGSGLRQPFRLAVGGQTYLATLFEWLDGRQVNAWLAQPHRRMAEILARLHGVPMWREIENCQPCTIRRDLDRGALIGTLYTLGDRLKQDHRKNLGMIALKLLETEPAECLVHGDPAESNFLILRDGRTALIDFDNCGLGSPDDDLGVVYCHLFYMGAFRSLWPPFIKSYIDASGKDIPHHRIMRAAARYVVNLLAWYELHPRFARNGAHDTYATANRLIDRLLREDTMTV